ncbi:MAG: hypothetical protein PWP27_578 [Clostridiales bacterium]|nr:hypothetical protein [Clostridiales bacterium]MDK2932768.1 hypothetical protein [Clostridiales bacterium]
MISDHANTRKHYRVYAKRNIRQSAKNTSTWRNKNKITMLIGLVGIAFIKGLFWGYILKNNRR